MVVRHYGECRRRLTPLEISPRLDGSSPCRAGIFGRMSLDRIYRAGAAIEDYCRACKLDRMHTVIAVDGGGRPVRVACDNCRSEHNFRGGARMPASGASPAATSATSTTSAPRP